MRWLTRWRATKEYFNLTVSVTEGRVPSPAVAELEELRMRKGGKSYVKHVDSSSQVVIMKAKPARTYVKVTQQNSGKLKYTYVRTELGVWTRIEKGRRIDDWDEVD